MDDPPIDGYVRCCDCGVLVLGSFARQTGRRCPQCWKDRHPLATLEVTNRSVRMSARAANKKRGPRKTKPVPEAYRDNRKARYAAQRRMAFLFPDVFAMVLDEERAERGLAPIARYEPLDFKATASETLAFEDVYAALDSEGVNDA